MKHNYYAYDANGNVSDVINGDSGAIYVHYKYSPFGETVVQAGDAQILAQNPYAFSTKYRNHMAGLYYYGHRFNNPLTGRWINRDPLGDFVVNHQYFKDKTNDEARNLYRSSLSPLYLFAHNNPETRFDPFGLDDSLSNPSCCYFEEGFTWLQNIASEAERIEREEFSDYGDPFGGDYRHCLAGCILVRSHGAAIAACGLRYWDSNETDPADSAAGWSGYRGAMSRKRPANPV
jgi:RHS repeat-associated protein